MFAYSSIVEFTPIYKQCSKSDCVACVELACRVNQGKVPYDKVEPLMKRFLELKEESRISKNSPCHFGECDECPDVSCGVWHGLAALSQPARILVIENAQVNLVQKTIGGDGD